MPYIPHTDEDTAAMLQTIGISSIDELFSDIPRDVSISSLTGIPAGLNEMAVGQLMTQRASHVEKMQCFLGAGAYEHHIPALIWDIAMRGENLTAYTPYQAEASQGTLQLLWEYQTMMASLMAMEVSNGSLYDGASALAEAVLMAVRLKHKSNHPVIFVPTTLHPLYRRVLTTLLQPQTITIVEIPYDETQGIITLEMLDEIARAHPELTALIIPQPNFFGRLEQVDALTRWAHAHQALVIGVVNPLAMAWLKPPGQWGDKGADIACGEGQPLGIPLAGGGPYFGFLCCRLQNVRQLPGRLVGRTQDKAGNVGFTLTLQAREQHIRRGKATSNICTNQGLMVTAATMYMSLLGPLGLKQLAQTCYQQCQFLLTQLTAVSGVKPLFVGPHFHEVVLQLPQAPQKVIALMRAQGIFPGLDLEKWYPALKNTLLVCVTETKSEADILTYVRLLSQSLA